MLAFSLLQEAVWEMSDHISHSVFISLDPITTLTASSIIYFERAYRSSSFSTRNEIPVIAIAQGDLTDACGNAIVHTVGGHEKLPRENLDAVHWCVPPFTVPAVESVCYPAKYDRLAGVAQRERSS